MALRVLLADESSTIKKIFQLALQDYAVDVVAVNSGADVLPVAARFNPDIIFADVLLQNQSGYEVAALIKDNPQLKELPVVLIWSGFVGLDDDKFHASKASGHLEKPFDAKKLRELVQTLVPKTKTQSLSDFLTFPQMPNFDEGPAPAPGAPAPPAPAGDLESHEGGEGGEAWSMESFEPMDPIAEPAAPPADPGEEFQELSIPKANVEESEEVAEVVSSDDEEEGNNEWMQKTLTSFQLKLPEDDEGEDQLDVSYEVPEEKIDGDAFAQEARNPNLETPEPPVAYEPLDDEHLENEDELSEAALLEDSPEDLELDLTPPSDREKAPLRHAEAAGPALTEEELEAVIRGQAKEMLETVIWRVVPELATQMIEREINRLLKERESKS